MSNRVAQRWSQLVFWMRSAREAIKSGRVIDFILHDIAQGGAPSRHCGEIRIGAKFHDFRLSTQRLQRLTTAKDRLIGILESRPNKVRRGTIPFFKNMDKQPKPFTVVVEGNIGSGKTTFLNYFSKFKDVEVLQEPVEKWRNVEGHNLLVCCFKYITYFINVVLFFHVIIQGLLYDNPARWCLTFQTHVQLTMLDHHTKETSAKVKLMERSLYSGRYCFVENLHQSKLMEPAEYSVISEWFKWITSNVDVGVDLIGKNIQVYTIGKKI